MTWRSVLGGVLALALLEATVSSTASAGRVGQLLDNLSTVIAHVLSPTVAAIPDLRKHGGAAKPGSSSSSSSSSSSGSSSSSTSGGSSGSSGDWWNTGASGIYNT